MILRNCGRPDWQYWAAADAFSLKARPNFDQVDAAVMDLRRGKEARFEAFENLRLASDAYVGKAVAPLTFTRGPQKVG